MDIGIGDIIYRTLCAQGESILRFAESFDESIMEEAVDIIYQCCGMVIVTGAGKSGNIAGKIASTLTSTGTPSIYLSPGEAIHGGLGIIRPGDVLIVLSKSGETTEIIDMLGAAEHYNIPIISITCSTNSTLTRVSKVVIPYEVKECCGTNFIPTTSTTLALVIGDAIAMTLMKKRNFKVEQFAKFHPGGSLGQLVQDSLGEVQFPHIKLEE